MRTELVTAPQECIVREDAPLGVQTARNHVPATAPNCDALLQSPFMETLNVACP